MMNGKNQITYSGLEMHQKSTLLLKKAKMSIHIEKKLGQKVNNNKQMKING